MNSRQLDEERIFHTARKILDIEAQNEYLVQVCGENTKLRERILELLNAESGSFLASGNDSRSNPHVPRVLGDFQILGELGRGGMGTVYEARQVSLNRKVALKVLSSGLGLTGKAVLRFRREAEAAAKLHHTNIVPIYSTGEDNGVHFYAMELVDGPSLDHVVRHMKQTGKAEVANYDDSIDDQEPSEQLPDWVTETIAFDGPQTASSRSVIKSNQSSSSLAGSGVASGTRYFDSVATMIADVAEALDHAHEHGVIHRDIKPSNLLLGPDGRLSVNDFGLARVLEQPGMTMSGEIMGTPRYMSPEQITAGRAPLDHRTDIYSLGATLYELLTLEPPFPGNTRDEVIGQILHKEPKSPRKLNRRIPKDLETVCLKAIERDPDRRYQTATQLATDLRAFVSRFAISARRIGPVRKSLRWAQRNPAWSTLAAVILVTLAGIGFYTRAALKEAKELALLFSMAGEYELAGEKIERARWLGARRAWLKLSEGQIAVFKGDYEVAQDLLSQAKKLGADHIPTRSLETIALLNGGQEISHTDRLLEIKTAIDNGDLVPRSDSDLLYLGLAHMWAQPRESLAFLRLAKEKGASGRVLQLIRSSASCSVAEDEVDVQKAIGYAMSSVTDASSDLKSGSSFELSRYISAQRAAARAYHRNNEGPNRTRAIDAAEKVIEAIDPESSVDGNLNFAIYLFFLELKDEERADEFLLRLKDQQLNSFLRTYRIIRQIKLGNLDMAKNDFDAFPDNGQLSDSDRLTKSAHWALVQLAQNRDPKKRKRITEEFQTNLENVLSTGRSSIAHIEIFWAVSRLLDLRPQSLKCVVAMERMKNKYVGTYVEQIMLPVLDVAKSKIRPADVVAASAASRRRLAYAHFALGIDALARGDRGQARVEFKACVEEGYPPYYVVHISRAFLARLKKDPQSFVWIPSIDAAQD